MRTIIPAEKDALHTIEIEGKEVTWKVISSTTMSRTLLCKEVPLVGVLLLDVFGMQTMVTVFQTTDTNRSTSFVVEKGVDAALGRVSRMLINGEIAVTASTTYNPWQETTNLLEEKK